jgi:DNA-binding transcriptional ArsR family regulator
VVANRTRLNIFGLLVREGAQTVSAVAERLNLTLPVASQSLRALEARGFLISRRIGRRVEYRLSHAPANLLVASMRGEFRRDSHAVETIFRLATAFTHPRRVEVFRALAGAGRTLEQLQASTRIPRRALRRHLAKLELRGFILRQKGACHLVERMDGLGRAIASLALG